MTKTSVPETSTSAPHLILLYHFFHPDEVISARLFSDLASSMAQVGWRVTAMPAARLYANDAPLPRSESWHRVAIERVPRPAVKQSSNRGRIINALFMLLAWSWRALVLPRSAGEVVVIGTDPVLSILVALPWRLLRPRARIIHWCHDLHPEASLAEGTLNPRSWIVRALRWLLKLAYRRCDELVDLGPCMRRLLWQDLGSQASMPALSASQAKCAQLVSKGLPTLTTITPWALAEPGLVSQPDPQVRASLFGDSPLACLYSGNLGRAHQYDLFLSLAELTQADGIGFCFAGRGARMSELKQQVDQQRLAVRFADFASEQQLHQRLEAGDVHLVSLRESWTGTVVPSKFFGALAIGRPVLFLGSGQCAVAEWILEHQVGWHLTTASLDEVAERLRELARDPAGRQALNERCRRVYQRHFSKEQQLLRWQALLGVSPRPTDSSATPQWD